MDSDPQWLYKRTHGPNGEIMCWKNNAYPGGLWAVYEGRTYNQGLQSPNPRQSRLYFEKMKRRSNLYDAGMHNWYVSSKIRNDQRFSAAREEVKQASEEVTNSAILEYMYNDPDY